MHCIILFPGPDGRLPTANQLRRAGFRLSAAAPDPEGEKSMADAGLSGPYEQGGESPAAVALAAEESSPYLALPE